MKSAKYLRVVPVLGLFAFSAAHAETVDQQVKALPAAVQKTLTAESPQGGVVKIEPKTMEGAMRYKIGIQSQGQKRTLVIESTGNLLVAKTEVSTDALPAPVGKTLDGQTQGAQVESRSLVSKAGKTYYEVELQVSGHKKELLIEQSGELTRIEEVVPIESVPPIVKSAIEKRASQGKLLKVKTIIFKGKLVAYEAAVDVKGLKSEFKLTPEAQPFN